MLTHTKKNNNSFLETTALLTGFEPATSGLEVQCAIHCATRAFFFCVVHVQTLTYLRKRKFYFLGLPGFQPGSVDSESPVPTATPEAPLY